MKVVDASLWEPYKLGSQELPSRNHEGVSVRNDGDCIVFENRTNQKVRFKYARPVSAPVDNVTSLCVVTEGSFDCGSGAFWFDKCALPLCGKTNIPCKASTKFHIMFECSANSVVRISKCDLCWLDEELDLADECGTDADVLVVVPGYPSASNLYECAFAHSRNRRYVESGLSVQVIATTPFRKHQRAYSIDGVPVLLAGVTQLKKLISRKQYKVIVTHFVDGYLYRIFDGYVTNEQLIFICHGPETVYKYLANVTRPYFCRERSQAEIDKIGEDKTEAIERYARKDNVHWVFVSEWLRDKSESEQGLTFLNQSCINNTIDPRLFPYKEKAPEDRKRILVLRKFDNNRNHSADIMVETLLELSRRPFFGDLQVDIIGDGSHFNELTAPLRSFSNVSITRGFVPNNRISEVYADHGIMLIPSRHDAHAVSMSEAAASGVVVVGSDVTSNPYYMDNEHNHTLAPAEDPKAHADIIERLYNNETEFLEISKRLSARIASLCSIEETSDKEVSLIREKIHQAEQSWNSVPSVVPSGDPILSVIVPAYNLEDYLGKCLHSLLAQRNASRMEVLVVNDGSKDMTVEVARRYEIACPGVVRVIDKENGGHGSTINVGIREAKGKYLRIVDGDDWVHSENLAKQIDRLAEETADLVMTEGAYERATEPGFASLLRYPMLDYDRIYRFDDLVYPLYGFDTYGPMLPNSTYRTKALQDAAFQLSEKIPYVDMEFNAFSLRYVETLVYYELDIYRYYVGREGQSISRDSWRRHYNNHRRVIFNIINTLEGWNGYPEAKKRYVREHILGAMIDTQIFMYDQIEMLSEMDDFLGELAKHPDVKRAAMKYIDTHSPNSQVILKRYKAFLRGECGKGPIIGSNGKPRAVVKTSKKIRRALRGIAPYDLIVSRQKHRKDNKKKKEDERKAWGL